MGDRLGTLRAVGISFLLRPSLPYHPRTFPEQ
jgi:hypothetical protein